MFSLRNLSRQHQSNLKKITAYGLLIIGGVFLVVSVPRWIWVFVGGVVVVWLGLTLLKYS